MKISYKEFVHPEDEAALRNLKTLLGFDLATKFVMEFGIEQFFHGLLMAKNVRLGPSQLPEIYNILPPVCQKFGIEEPEFYLEMNPIPNAYTIGDKQRFVVVTSGLLDHVTNENELRAVVAHECGHIMCRHVFYMTMAMMIVLFGQALGLAGKLIAPISVALNYWMRRSELSADRAAAVYMGKPDAMIGALLRLAGGPAKLTGKINVDEYLRQADAYDELRKNSKWQKLLQAAAIMDENHPFSSVRVQELRKWAGTEQFSLLGDALSDPENLCICSQCGRLAAHDHFYCRHCGGRMRVE